MPRNRFGRTAVILVLIGVTGLGTMANEQKSSGSGGTSNAAAAGSNTDQYGCSAEDRQDAMDYAEDRMSKYKWDESQFDALRTLWKRESNWCYKADNPTSSAYGIPQALTAQHFSKREAKRYMGSPRRQVNWGLAYIKKNYGTPKKALKFHNKNNWY